MKRNTKSISPLSNFLVVSNLVNLIFMAFGAIVFAFFPITISIDRIAIIIIIIFLLYKGFIVGFVVNWGKNSSKYHKLSGTKFIGFYFGRFYLLIVGLFLGKEIGNGIGAIVGALSFYFLGRWVGPKVGLFIGSLINRNLFEWDTNLENQIAT